MDFPDPHQKPAAFSPCRLSGGAVPLHQALLCAQALQAVPERDLLLQASRRGGSFPDTTPTPIFFYLPPHTSSLRRVYVINKEICVRTVCAHEELLRGKGGGRCTPNWGHPHLGHPLFPGRGRGEFPTTKVAPGIAPQPVDQTGAEPPPLQHHDVPIPIGGGPSLLFCPLVFPTSTDYFFPAIHAADLCRDKFSKCGVMATSGLCQTVVASCARSCGGC